MFEDLCKLRKGNATDLICGYLNINSLRYKHERFKDLLQRNLFDLLFLFETKIDESFPPNMLDNVFNTDFSQAVDKIISRYDKYILIGDLNCDMLNSSNSETLMDICDVFDLKNVVNKAACFTKNSKPTLLDAILTSENTKC